MGTLLSISNDQVCSVSTPASGLCFVRPADGWCIVTGSDNLLPSFCVISSHDLRGSPAPMLISLARKDAACDIWAGIQSFLRSALIAVFVS